jgi:CheY-like chemotaxis protein
MTIKILYIEDEKDMVALLPLLLGEKGIEVTSTGSISEALDKLKDSSFDGVLLDIMMPPTDDMKDQELDYGRTTGIEVARRIKAIRPAIPIIAFTALTDQDVRQKMYEVGVIKIIEKPSEIDKIASILRQALTGD